MAVFRVERNTGYTVMSNHHLRNKELTLKAKGLLSQMLSLPEDWDYIAPIIGRICMDQTIIDITDIPTVKEGDIAIIIGKSGNAEITAYDIAEQTGTITNEILSRLGSRLDRFII